MGRPQANPRAGLSGWVGTSRKQGKKRDRQRPTSSSSLGPERLIRSDLRTDMQTPVVGFCAATCAHTRVTPRSPGGAAAPPPAVFATGERVPLTFAPPPPPSAKPTETQNVVSPCKTNCSELSFYTGSSQQTPSRAKTLIKRLFAGWQGAKSQVMS